MNGIPQSFQYLHHYKKGLVACIAEDGTLSELPLAAFEAFTSADPNQVRVHRAWIINKKHVVSVLPGNAFHMALLQMTNGTVVPVQKSYLGNILDLISR